MQVLYTIQHALYSYCGCRRNSAIGYEGDGFPAAAGWDPVTGLGTPVYSKLLQAVTSLP
jgi:hypothetical protein